MLTQFQVAKISKFMTIIYVTVLFLPDNNYHKKRSMQRRNVDIPCIDLFLHISFHVLETLEPVLGVEMLSL